MSSPTTETFFVYDLTTGAPKTGAAAGMSFDTYKNDQGTDLSQPTIFEIGGGVYGFNPTFTAGRGIAYVLNTGTGGNPAKLNRYMRPEDYNTDAIPTIQTIVQNIKDYDQGKWQIFATGPNANQMWFYASDGVTVLAKYNLLDADGNPTVFSPFTRVPTT